MCVHSVLGAKRIARQYWRAWIETSDAATPAGQAQPQQEPQKASE